ncbi:MAG: isochorismatase family protein [Terrimicrobiaceae bacterium]
MTDGTKRPGTELIEGDALVIVDVQNDFLPGGALAVPQSDEILPVLNSYIAAFERRGLPIYVTRDWHPPNHCSFKECGGPWPAHCVAGTHGAEFSTELKLNSPFTIVSKATTPAVEAYSDFSTTNFEPNLRAANVSRLFVGGLATDYCVFSTVKDALALGFTTCLLLDAIRGVNVQPDDGEKAAHEMIRLGAVPISLQDLAL